MRWLLRAIALGLIGGVAMAQVGQIPGWPPVQPFTQGGGGGGTGGQNSYPLGFP